MLLWLEAGNVRGAVSLANNTYGILNMCYEVNKCSSISLTPRSVYLPKTVTRAQANKGMRHTLAHVTSQNDCQMEENENSEENILFSIYKDINKTQAQHCGYSSQEELCSPAKRTEQQTSVSPNCGSRDVI